MKLGSSDWLTVVGVVGDVRYEALANPDESVRPMMYIPYWQRPDASLTFVVRARIAPQSLVEDLRQRWPAGQGLRLGRIETMTALLRQASVAQRFSMSLVAVFAASAVILAAVALYGLLALLVGRRTREIGVRLALGATRWDVVRLILNRTLPAAEAPREGAHPLRVDTTYDDERARLKVFISGSPETTCGFRKF